MPTGSPGTREEAKAIMRRLIDEVWAEGKVELADELFHPQAICPSAATLPADVSEIEQLGLETVPLPGSRLPRLKAARVAYACSRYDIQEIGPAKQSLIIGRIRQIYLDDAIVDTSVEGRIRVDAGRLDPIARLGASDYAMLSDIVRLKRPD